MNYFDNKTILVPFDFSHFSAQAVETAIEIASKVENITVLHVIDPTPVLGYVSDPGLSLGGRNMGMENIDQIAEFDEQHRHRALKLLEDQFGDAHHRGLHFDVVADDAPHGITDYAAQQNVDLIILPSHGRTGVKRLLMGSTAERVVRLAHCPVMVLRS